MNKPKQLYTSLWLSIFKLCLYDKCNVIIQQSPDLQNIGYKFSALWSADYLNDFEKRMKEDIHETKKH